MGTGNGDPDVPELQSALGYSWATLSPGVYIYIYIHIYIYIYMEDWSSRLGVGREVDNLTM
jgi:hypothetical protein